MIIIAAKCPFCGKDAPLSCGRFEFQLPPHKIVCEKCGKEVATTQKFRANWISSLLFKALFALSFLGLLGAVHEANVSFVFMVVLCLIVAFLFAFFASPLLTIAFSPILKMLRWI